MFRIRIIRTKENTHSHTHTQQLWNISSHMGSCNSLRPSIRSITQYHPIISKWMCWLHIYRDRRRSFQEILICGSENTILFSQFHKGSLCSCRCSCHCSFSNQRVTSTLRGEVLPSNKRPFVTVFAASSIKFAEGAFLFQSLTSLIEFNSFFLLNFILFCGWPCCN
ncbi:hypothetical protein ABFS83_02G071400 [Erythranthe nasuta]